MFKKLCYAVVGLLIFLAVGIAAAPPAPPASTAPSVVSISTQSTQADLRAHHHRMGAAEQMVKRLTDKVARARKICDALKEYRPKLSEECNAGVSTNHPIFAAIPEAASIGEPRWTAVVDIARKLEDGLDRALAKVETYVK